MKRIEIISLNNILNPIVPKHLEGDSLLKVLKIKASVTDCIKKIDSDKQLFVTETKPEDFKEGDTLTDELKNQWESKFQPIYNTYLMEDADISFKKLDDKEFTDLVQGCELSFEALEVAYNLLVIC